MPAPTQEQVLDALRAVQDPELRKDLAGQVSRRNATEPPPQTLGTTHEASH